MTNIYNGLIDNVERGLGLKRRETEQALRGMNELLPPDALLRYLLNQQENMREWREEAAALGTAGQKKQEQLSDAVEIALKIVNPIFSQDTRTGCYTKVAGNFLAGLMDVWVQQDPFEAKSSSPPRQAHVVEYDMINMETVKLAADRMIDAMDSKPLQAGESKRGNNKKTTTEDFTNGYMRIVNGLVREAFAEALEKAGIEDIDAHLQQVRLSNGDEFRLVVAGLSDEEVKAAIISAQKRVLYLVNDLGFDALPHLKHLKDDQKWHEIQHIDQLHDGAIYNALKYGGAGIKIGFSALGEGVTTAELEHALDVSIHDNKEARAAERARRIEQARNTGTAAAPAPPPFNSTHPLVRGNLGYIPFDQVETFKRCIKKVHTDAYDDYYRRPKVERREFPYDITNERRNAVPCNNPEYYIDEYIAIAGHYLNLGDSVKRRLEYALKDAFTTLPSGDAASDSRQLASLIITTIEQVLDHTSAPSDLGGARVAKEKLAVAREPMSEELQRYLDTFNPYESFDLTRKRLLDREAVKLQLSDEQREILLYKPLAFCNARDEYGVCMNGRVKEALKIFQSDDRQPRQYSYIGLSSFAGTNEVSSALGRSINEHIRSIAAEELKIRFGKKALDFAFNVESGRLNLLTHGLSKNELVEALSCIEKRADKEINQQPLGSLFRRYKIFTKKSADMALVPREENHPNVEAILEKVHEARRIHGDDTPLVFADNDGETIGRLLRAEDKTPAIEAALAEGKTLFLEERKKAIVMAIPPHVETYLKKAGYVNEQGALDLTKPLAILPNPKHTHERGIRVITAHVALLGSAAELAEQRKGELYRIVEAKKRRSFKPGEGHEIELPVEATPNYSPQIHQFSKVGKNKPSAGGDNFSSKPRITSADRRAAAHARRLVDPLPAFSPGPLDQAAWLRKLDQHEFALLQQRQVPQTILQLIANPLIHVTQKDDDTFLIKISRQVKRYDSEHVETPGRRALFIKTALEEHLGKAVSVVGINPEKLGGNREIILHVNINGLASENISEEDILMDRKPEPVKFMEDLTAFKARQVANAKAKMPQDIEEALKQSVSKYAFQLRAIRLLRQFPTVTIEKPGNRNAFTFKFPRVEGERQSFRRKKADAFLDALNELLGDKAYMEEEPEPFSTRSGGSSNKSRLNYEIRVDATRVSKDILDYMKELQFSTKSAATGRG